MNITINTGRDILEVKRYLTEEYKISNKTCKSSYFAALMHARILTGRDIKNGNIINEESTGDWAGACMYLILIDHIGEKFSTLNSKIIAKNDFLKTLKHFTDLDDVTCEILYQLRNSFLHNFNLYNIPDDKKYTPRHFAVNRGDNIVSMPDEDFNGKLNNIKPKNTTTVSLKKIGDLVEGIHKKILKLLEGNELLIIVPEGLNLTDILKANTICY